MAPATVTGDRARTQRVIATVSGLEESADPAWADAAAIRPIGPESLTNVSLIGYEALPAETPVAVATAPTVRWRRPHLGRPGRWTFTRPRHERRCAAGAAYLLARTDGPDHDLADGLLAPARLIDECLDGRWQPGDVVAVKRAHLPWLQVSGALGGDQQ
jgi:hypothetical protein